MLSLSISEYSEYSTTELYSFLHKKEVIIVARKLHQFIFHQYTLIYIHQFRIILTEIIGQTAISLNAYRFNTINMYARRKSQ